VIFGAVFFALFAENGVMSNTQQAWPRPYLLFPKNLTLREIRSVSAALWPV
jgi:hypothetical protein